MNILFAASELSPYAKTGGLGDVIGALPAALRERGHSVSIVLPFYRGIREQLPDLAETPIEISVPLSSATYSARIWRAKTHAGVQLFLVQRDEFYDRSEIYGTRGGDYEDNASRFIFFSKVAVELARYIKPLPEIIHVHDWQTAIVPALVRAGGLPFRTVYTIHNLAFQGSFWAFDFNLTNLPGEYFSPPGVEFYGRLNLMKAGIMLAHQITTVSPRYAEEIQTPAFGFTLEGILQDNKHKLTGILNGVDYDIWDPEADQLLPEPYNAEQMEGKEACKKSLLASMKLPAGPQPVFGMVARMTNQKGYDLLALLLDELLTLPAKFVFLGSGDPHYEEFMQKLQKKHPKKLAVTVGYDEALAHRIEAGSDFFLMPSQFEPCGLNQMYSMAYGTPPIVHETGGMADTVETCDEASTSGTGFRFWPYEPIAMRKAIESALKIYADKEKLHALRLRAMAKRFDWDASAAAYEKVYERALK